MDCSAENNYLCAIMFMLLLRLKRYFCKHDYWNYATPILNETTLEWEVPDCTKCGKVWKSSIPKYTNPPLPPPERAVVADGVPISGEFIYHKGRLDFICHNKDAKYSEVLAAITAVRNECQRQISNQDNCPFKP